MTPIDVDGLAILTGVTVLAAAFIVALGVTHAAEQFDAQLLADFGSDTNPASPDHRPETETA